MDHATSPTQVRAHTHITFSVAGSVPWLRSCACRRRMTSQDARCCGATWNRDGADRLVRHRPLASPRCSVGLVMSWAPSGLVPALLDPVLPRADHPATSSGGDMQTVSFFGRHRGRNGPCRCGALQGGCGANSSTPVSVLVLLVIQVLNVYSRGA